MSFPILLIFPPTIIHRKLPRSVQVPLGLAYLAAYLQKAGHEVHVLDSLLEGWDFQGKVDDNFLIWGLPLINIKKTIENIKPKIVGISCLFTAQAKSAYKVCDIIKEVDPKITTVLGGAHPSSVPELALKNNSVDCVIKGEGETSFSELIYSLKNQSGQNKIKGVLTKDNIGKDGLNSKVFIDNLDALPFPAYHHFDLEKYFEINRPHGGASHRSRVLSIITSRGCPFKCTFCSIHSVWGKGLRHRSPENVLNELTFIKKKYHIEELQFEDDNLTFNKKNAIEIFEGMAKKKLAMPWSTPNGVAIWTLDRELLKKMRQSGCYKITLAVESGNQEVLTNIIKKPLQLSKVKEVVKNAKELGIMIDSFFMIGLPGETKDQMNETFRFARKLPVDNVRMFIATPYPGTDLYDICVKKGYLKKGIHPEDITNYFSGYVKTEEFDTYELEKMISRQWVIQHLYIFIRQPKQYFIKVLYPFFQREPSALFNFLFDFIKIKK